jgi:hypothetical protein
MENSFQVKGQQAQDQKWPFFIGYRIVNYVGGIFKLLKVSAPPAERVV